VEFDTLDFLLRMPCRKAEKFVKRVYEHFIEEGDIEDWKLFLSIIVRLYKVKDSNDLQLASYVIARLIKESPWLLYEYCTFLPLKLRVDTLLYLHKSKQIDYPDSLSYVFKHRND